MTNAFAATYSDFKLIKTRSCVQVIFEVPLHAHQEAMLILGGMPEPGAERWFAIAPLDPKLIREARQLPAPEPIESPQARIGSERLRRQLTLSQRIALVCKEALFQRFVERETGVKNRCDDKDAAEYFRFHCDVDTRGKIKPGTDAARIAEGILNRYAAWKAA